MNHRTPLFYAKIEQIKILLIYSLELYYHIYISKIMSSIHQKNAANTISSCVSIPRFPFFNRSTRLTSSFPEFRPTFARINAQSFPTSDQGICKAPRIPPTIPTATKFTFRRGIMNSVHFPLPFFSSLHYACLFHHCPHKQTHRQNSACPATI